VLLYLFQWERLFKPRLTGARPDSAVLEASVAPFQETLGILETNLTKRNHVTSDEVTLAGIAIAGSLMEAVV
jgi:hypothetical protein